MKGKNLIFIIAFITLIVLIGGVFLVSKTTQSPQVAGFQDAKAYVIDATSFDWGNIPMNGGLMTKTFTIKNTGTDTLKLLNIKTSCHCTKAHVTIDGKKSPDFGMDGISSWVGEVTPGKEAKLTAIFDPAYHGPQGVGPMNRFVSVETNDRGISKLAFTLTGTVVK
ncbi:MAG: DUF1573 domain-containing protein [Candidatus Curtissbacteria bacterium]|nr:DUF1573 domain-containing protein [Candidatus Curtissbacteria bacterium]